MTQINDVFYERVRCGVRAVTGAMRSVMESLDSLREKAIPPRVSRGPADAVASTGLGETERALLYFEDEAYSLFVHSRLVPLHRALLGSEPLVDRNLSTISVGHCVKDQGRLNRSVG